MSEQEQVTRREIRGISKPVRELLSGVKYSVDYYQREYKWTTKQVQELIEDLTGRFTQDYDERHERHDVINYGHYFLGSIVISAKKGKKFIIDGQQRLTTLTLLLIFLHNLQQERNDQVNIKDLIFSEKYGKKSFNLDVEDRRGCMDALFSQDVFDSSAESESVRNIQARYEDIESLFPEDIKNGALPYFIDWLIENVHLVEITAYSDDDAYTIFETMNDRGLSLSATDMLKGYLLANITDEEQRNKAVLTWKRVVGEIADISENKEEVADFFKAWLRSQYATNIREGRSGAKPQDFDRIGTEFHRWVREKRETLGLTKGENFYDLIVHNMVFYARQYILVRRAAYSYNMGLDDVFHISQIGFTLHYQTILAPLRPDDDEQTILQKIRIVAAYLEIFLVRRIWNWRSIAYKNLVYTMFILMREIRGKSAQELVEILSKRLKTQDDKIDNLNFSMHKMNRWSVHRLLARMTDTIERGTGAASHYLEYINVSGDPKNPYEVEHIWANKFEYHDDEFAHPADFSEYRGRVGGLLLLPKKFNASYGALPYQDKYEHYFGQNLLAKSLHERCYEHHSGFAEFIKRTGLSFKHHPKFKKDDLATRQKLYLEIANYTWRPERLTESLQ
jgi:uncharacterized protein with ParB-like and HNH nuclease domain